MNELVAFSFLGLLANLPYIIAGILALGVAVFVHELGHFVVGRWVGIRAEAFSIGFGPILWRKKVGETEYRLSSILAGGYVKFAGMEGTEGKTPQEVEGGFFAVSPARRILASFAGPFMNVVLAFVLFFILWGTGRKVPEGSVTTVVGGFIKDSPAEAAGLKPGDRIVSISGRPVNKFRDVIMGVAVGGDTLNVAAERGDQLLDFEIKPKLDPDQGVRMLGIVPSQRMTVHEVMEGSAAEKMDLRKGDLLLCLDGKRVYDGLTGWHDGLRDRAGKAIEITVERDGKEIALAGTMPKGTKEKPPVLGFNMAPVFAWIYEQPLEAAGGVLGDMWHVLKGLVSRRVKAKALAGPVGIVSIIILSLKVSFTSFLWIAAMISLNLAIINLLPIPVVDGGHITFGLLEAARRKPVRERTMVILTNVFAALIIAFFLYVTFNDFVRLWTPASDVEEETQKESGSDTPDKQAPPDGAAPAPDPGSDTDPGANGTRRLGPGAGERLPVLARAMDLVPLTPAPVE